MKMRRLETNGCYFEGARRQPMPYELEFICAGCRELCVVDLLDSPLQDVNFGQLEEHALACECGHETDVKFRADTTLVLVMEGGR